MDSKETERQALMQKLLDSVKQCQSTFGGKTNLASESDSCVSCLLSQFEHALQHGLKKNKILEKITSISEPFRQVTQKMLPEIEITFWSPIKENFGPLDIQHFNSLEGITTDAGRARAWLRTALNENSLERNLTALLANPNILKQYYEHWALLLDEERASTLPIMAQGLGSILFAVSTRNTDLNQPFKDISFMNASTRHFKTHRRVNSSPLPVMAGFETEPSILKKINVKKKKKRKVATINDLEEIPGEIYSSSFVDENKAQYSSSYGGYTFTKEHSRDNFMSSAKSDFETKNISIRSAPVSPTLTEDFNDIQESIDKTDNDAEHKSTLSKTLKSLSMDHKNESTEKCAIPQLANQEQLEIINPVENGNKNEASNLISPSETCHEEIPFNGNINNDIVSSFTNKTILSMLPHTSDGENNADDSGNTKENDSITTSSPSDSMVEDVGSLGSENSKYVELFMSYDQESSQAATDTLALLSASTDNVVFDVQTLEQPDGPSSDMDKYIPKVAPPVFSMKEGSDLSAVDLKQAILATAKKKDEVQKRNHVLQAALEEQRELARLTQSDYETLQIEHHASEESKKKKIQDLTREVEVLKNQLKKYVAAVQMLRKDKILSEEAKEAIGNLKVPVEDVTVPPQPKDRTTSENNSIFEDKLAQMAEMHGELMEFQEILQRQLVARDQQIVRMKQELVSLRGPLPQDLENSEPSLGSSESLYTKNRLLINIWIPSVFLKGKGTDEHHLYQIYLRIGDEEWNIYRRYSQFNKLNTLMCKSYPELEKFNFPKKKMFGKKDRQFVEARRHNLQEYLRALINTCISNHTELTANSSKLQLVNFIPFFGEQFGNSDEKKKNKNGNNKQESPHYTGLISFPQI